MMSFLLRLSPAITLALLLSIGPVHQATAIDGLPLEEEVCGDYGTSVVFLDSVADAAQQATKAEKLVFVLHVSGNFEVPDFT